MFFPYFVEMLGEKSCCKHNVWEFFEFPQKNKFSVPSRSRGGEGAVGLHPPGSPAPLLFSPNSLPLPTGVPTWVPHFACRAVPSPSEVHLLGHREEDVHCFVSFALQNADVVILVPGGAFLRRACTRVLLNYLQPPPPGRAGLR